MCVGRHQTFSSPNQVPLTIGAEKNARLGIAELEEGRRALALLLTTLKGEKKNQG